MIAEQARGKWRDILTTLGVPQEHLTGRHGPCPACGGKDRFRFDDYEGRGMYYCNGCGAGDGFDLLRLVHGWDFKEAAKQVEGLIPGARAVEQNKADPLPRLRRIQAEVYPMGKAVRKYLAGRGIIGTWKRVYEHPAMNYYGGGVYAAMCCKVTDPNDRPVTWHVTYLHGGRKAPVEAPKKLMPCNGTVTGAAVRLGMGPHIAVTEGIETGMVVMNTTGIPTWAAISAGGMSKLQVPESVKKVTVYGDNDESMTGQAAAHTLAQRMYREGKRVEVLIPSKVGADWLDCVDEL